MRLEVGCELRNWVFVQLVPAPLTKTGTLIRTQ